MNTIDAGAGEELKIWSMRAWIYVLMAASVIFTLVTLPNYPGRGYVYLLFSVLLHALLVFGFRRGSMFIDTFLGLFFWIGYWLKFSVRTVFADGTWYYGVGHFDYSAHATDRALLVTSCGIAGLLFARVIRERFLFESLRSLRPIRLDGVRAVYNQHRVLVWVVFCILVFFVALTNAYFGIYQRGSVPRTVPPFGLGGIYTWLLLFGASSISAMLIHFELESRRRVAYFLIFLVLMEPFLSNVSMLSRGMILNGCALLLGTYICARVYRISLGFWKIFATLATLLILFAGSIYVVNQMRLDFFGLDGRERLRLQEESPERGGLLSRQVIDAWSAKKFEASADKFGNVGATVALLVMDRWIGIEGSMAVASFPDLGWDLWDEAWNEKYTHSGTSLYDREIAESGYAELDLSDVHFISMPGILAFFYYPGSYAFLFLSMLTIGILGALIEGAVYKWGGGNLILCSLMAFVVVYRFVHFGYVPGRSYLLFGAIVLNVAMIYLAGRLLASRSDKARPASHAG